MIHYDKLFLFLFSLLTPILFFFPFIFHYYSHSLFGSRGGLRTEIGGAGAGTGTGSGAAGGGGGGVAVRDGTSGSALSGTIIYYIIYR